ncbi:MAG: hypothetical protein JWR19_3432 [Pedosphaera sp.]|nr:hypothetical protein [Pedosphaera sp.]
MVYEYLNRVKAPVAIMKDRRPWLVFALVFCWKIALFVISAQPVPASDSYFYDGAVVHHLLHGGYYNPCLAAAFPISSAQVFSVYPPFYQVPLLAWMSVFGVSALSAMALHIFLIGIYMVLLLAIFRRLQTPGWCVQLAGAFLLLITFHDRPDTVAHVMGMLAIYSWVRSRRILSEGLADNRISRWNWLTVVCVVLTIATSLQIGGVYFLWVFLGTALACYAGKERFPIVPMAAMAAAPIVLVLMVKTFLPLPWEGFVEHARQTPFITGFRALSWQEVLKVVRSVPGILLVTILLCWSWFTRRRELMAAMATRPGIIMLPALLGSLGVVAACLTILSANIVGNIPIYLQPLIVACYLALFGPLVASKLQSRLQVGCFVLMVLLGSVRAVGMSTWGIVCARDTSYASVMRRVAKELESHPTGTEVVISSPFLYEAALHQNIKPIHSDWLVRVWRDQQPDDARALVARKPAQLILSQFEYYRRYQGILEKVKSDPQLGSMEIENTAKTPSPDSFKSIQRVLQNVSWAPVIVNLTWK